jgi:hypothetical protein
VLVLGLVCGIVVFAAASDARAQTASRVANDDDLRRFVAGAWANHQRDPDGTYRWRKWVFHPDGRTEFFLKSCIPFPGKDCAVEPAGPNEPTLETTWSVRRVADRRFTLTREYKPPYWLQTYRHTIIDRNTMRLEAQDAKWAEVYRRVE